MVLQVGIQQKPTDLKLKTSNLVHVNVLKDQVFYLSLLDLFSVKNLSHDWYGVEWPLGGITNKPISFHF